MNCELIKGVPLRNGNGSRLGEVGDFENETLKLLLNLN
jgi:hypothetical protein